MWVDHHDEAYQWAARKRCEVNTKTGAIQVFDVQTVVEQISTPEKVALFAFAKDDDLLKLGVPEVQLDLVRSFVNKEDFINRNPLCRMMLMSIFLGWQKVSLWKKY